MKINKVKISKETTEISACEFIQNECTNSIINSLENIEEIKNYTFDSCIFNNIDFTNIRRY